MPQVLTPNPRKAISISSTLTELSLTHRVRDSNLKSRALESITSNKTKRRLKSSLLNLRFDSSLKLRLQVQINQQPSYLETLVSISNSHQSYQTQQLYITKKVVQTLYLAKIRIPLHQVVIKQINLWRIEAQLRLRTQYLRLFIRCLKLRKAIYLTRLWVTWLRSKSPRIVVRGREMAELTLWCGPRLSQQVTFITKVRMLIPREFTTMPRICIQSQKMNINYIRVSAPITRVESEEGKHHQLPSITLSLVLRKKTWSRINTWSNSLRCSRRLTVFIKGTRAEFLLKRVI